MSDGLRIAYLCYRGNPHSGGQGVYTRHLTRELVALGHKVTVFAGQPWPVLDDGVDFVPVPSLDLYRPENPFRVPWPNEFRDRIDLAEFGIMCTAGFPEPYTFSQRIRRVLKDYEGQFDLVHDNQCLGSGMLGLMEDGWPLFTTIHHPITVDRDLELSHVTRLTRKLTLKRWYGFLKMQIRVAKQLPYVLTVSDSSKRDIAAQMGVPAEHMSVVNVGVDPARFRPLPGVARVPGRLMTTASADVPLKGLTPLLEALAKVRTERHAELVVVGKPRNGSHIPKLIEQLGLSDAVTFVSGVSDERIIELYAEAEVAVVPSLYEGFSLPAVEAQACGVPLVATTGGALPEVVGPDGETGLLVPPNDPGALAQAIGRALDDPELRARIGAAGRERALSKFTWKQTAIGTAAEYRKFLDTHDKARTPC